MTGPLSTKKRSGFTQRFKIATYCQIPEISNSGDNSLDNGRGRTRELTGLILIK